MPDFKAHLAQLLADAIEIVAPDHRDCPVEITETRQAAHGDFASNVALLLGKRLSRPPRDVARDLVAELALSPWVEKVEVAGAGFVNFFLSAAAKHRAIAEILERKAAYGRAAPTGLRIQVEFVSANPTGPLHVGHGRGAAYGASLANVLAAAGHTVEREFYVNDAGRQMDILALSTWLRYLELAGIAVPFPPNAYQGDYVREMARAIRDLHGDRFVHEPWHVLDGAPSVEEDAEAHLDALIHNAKRLLGEDYAYVHDFALTEQLGDMRNDLDEFGVVFDNWFSERTLFESGLVARAIARLEQAGYVYRQDGALWFRSTRFGDEKDRVVQRDNGQYTYFASDIAYHLNKYERGFDRIIDVWGADHHGYIARVKGAVQALGLPADRLTIALVQFAVLYRGKQKISMSTRAGEFVTLRALREEVGNDAARFFYVLRKSDQHLDFDLELAKSHTSDNPVYYVQYAHARCASVLAKWGGNIAGLAEVDLSPLANEGEMALLLRLSAYPETVAIAARELAPHHIAYYLRELAGEFHAYYNATQILVEDEATRLARLALVAAVRQVIANGLELLGVSAPDKM